MKYNEWVTQLNDNLLGVPETERRRVLDYYAEAYADRRAAGFSESEIIDGFGAPYDAAQAILENDTFAENTEKNTIQVDKTEYSAPPPHYVYAPPPPRPKAERKDRSWVFVVLCIIFAIPIFALVMSMAGITIGFAVAPFSTIAAGVAQIVYGIIGLATGDIGYGITYIGIGLICFGVGLILIKLCFALVKLMWQLFGKLFNWLAGLFKGESK